MVPSALRRRLLLSSTMLVAAVAGYGRRAYGACVFTSGSSYVCSGANVTTQTITANNASVSTVAGFSVNTAAGNAITITGDGALSYTDTNASPLTAPATRPPLFMSNPPATMSAQARLAASPSTPMAAQRRRLRH